MKGFTLIVDGQVVETVDGMEHVLRQRVVNTHTAKSGMNGFFVDHVFHFNNIAIGIAFMQSLERYSELSFRKVVQKQFCIDVRW